MGAVDIIVDIVGTLLCLEDLGVEKVLSSPVNLGGGAVRASHGMLPVPAPATAELLKGLPVYSSGVTHELTTPTGAAIIKGLASDFGSLPAMRLSGVGYGAGGRDTEDMPNVLRVLIGEAEPPEPRDGEVTVIEANIDDMNPQVYGYVVERLLAIGALDAYLTQVIMKKGRPGVLLTVLCPEEKTVEVSEAVFRETTTIGLRYRKAGRSVLSRSIRKIDTAFGRIRVKDSALGGEVIRCTPEYEDCRKAAEKHGVPLIRVLEEAHRASGSSSRKRGK
jgi:uncharacterized protein (TIGR00299 family) protein